MHTRERLARMCARMNKSFARHALLVDTRARAMIDTGSVRMDTPNEIDNAYLARLHLCEQAPAAARANKINAC